MRAMAVFDILMLCGWIIDHYVSSIHGFSFSERTIPLSMAIFDILMLCGWIIDHYVSSIHGFSFSERTIPLCKFFSFLNYFAAQSSAWLRVFISLDRY
ncbi:unnamed protein product [Rotaria sp. Silwood1]|nr:unnamed protein product [Rotaria sp. Silwood1]